MNCKVPCYVLLFNSLTTWSKALLPQPVKKFSARYWNWDLITLFTRDSQREVIAYYLFNLSLRLFSWFFELRRNLLFSQIETLYVIPTRNKGRNFYVLNFCLLECRMTAVIENKNNDSQIFSSTNSLRNFFFWLMLFLDKQVMKRSCILCWHSCWYSFVSCLCTGFNLWLLPGQFLSWSVMIGNYIKKLWNRKETY